MVRAMMSIISDINLYLLAKEAFQHMFATFPASSEGTFQSSFFKKPHQGGSNFFQPHQGGFSGKALTHARAVFTPSSLQLSPYYKHPPIILILKPTLFTP